MQRYAARRPDVRRFVDPGVDRLFVIIWPECPVDVREPDLIAAVDAFGVDGEKHFDAMSGPLGDLGGRHASVEPQRDAAVS